MVINAKVKIAIKLAAVIVLMLLAFGVGNLCGDVKYINNGYKAGYNEGYGEAHQEWSYILNGKKEVKKTE